MVRNTSALVPLAFQPLTLGEIRPAGWLARQLRIQADSLSGHLEVFWPDIAQSGWIGGDAEGWERGPYWLDGVVPLAYLLDDEHLTGRVRLWMDEILARQSDDGWLGPRQDTVSGRYKPLDPWPVSVFAKAALQYHEATSDARIIPALLRFYRRLDEQLERTPLYDWGRMRWAELVLGIYATYERSGEAWLLPLADKARRQGFDWGALFERYPYTGRTARADLGMPAHVVNNAMAIKGGAIQYRQTHNPADLAASWRMIDLLEAYHGQVAGVFTGDEHLAGRNPSQGTELCAVVEYMYSLEVLLTVLGDAALGDRLERIAYNALPATYSPDMWAHQYDQQVNQPVCQVAPNPVYTSNSPESNIYGLEPNYGCCTANMHQGWPKLAAHLWMRVPPRDGQGEGLVALSYAPCHIQTNVADADIAVTVEGEYPFSGSVRVAVDAAQPARFPVLLRIPRWAEGATLRVAGELQPAPVPGEYYTIERVWQGRVEIQLDLPMRLRTETRDRGAASVLCGPLVMALQIGEEWRQIGGEAPHADWEVHPTTPWNYALSLDRMHPELSVTVAQRPMGAIPFSPDGVPLTARVQAARVPGWGLERGTAGPVPCSPLPLSGELEQVTLVPYGATNLRIAEFPTLDLAPQHDDH